MRIIREEHGPCEEEGGQEIILQSSSAHHQDEEGIFCREPVSRAAGNTCELLTFLTLPCVVQSKKKTMTMLHVIKEFAWRVAELAARIAGTCSEFVKHSKPHTPQCKLRTALNG